MKDAPIHARENMWFMRKVSLGIFLTWENVHNQLASEKGQYETAGGQVRCNPSAFKNGTHDSMM